MANTYLQMAVTGNRKTCEGVDVDEILIQQATKIKLKNVRANRIIFAKENTDIEIDGFELVSTSSMPFLCQYPSTGLSGIHICNGLIDTSKSLDVTGDLQAMSFRNALLEYISIHDILFKGHCVNAFAMYKTATSAWRNIDVHHLYVMLGRNVSNSATSGGIHIGSDNPAGSLATNSKFHDCFVRDTVGFAIRRKDFGAELENIIGQNCTAPNDIYGAPNILSGESLEDIRARVISRLRMAA